MANSNSKAVELISIVSPFYNEAGNVSPFLGALLPVLATLDCSSEIVCINDGSSDETLAALLEAQRKDRRIRVIDLSRNFGKEAALTAGLDAARGAAVIPMDCDLQDPPELIPRLVEKWREGYDVVLAQRANRSADTRFKRLTAAWFYRLHNRIADVALPKDVGDFRLMDARVVEALRLLPERRRFMKGLFAWVGFRSAQIEYIRDARIHGRSKFNGWRLWNFALEGITAFSTVPLRVWSYVGAAVAALAFLYMLFVILRTAIAGVDVPGYASLFSATLFFGGMQLLGIGVLGEYIGRIYSETKQRPLYIVRNLYEALDESDDGDGAVAPKNKGLALRAGQIVPRRQLTTS